MTEPAIAEAENGPAKPLAFPVWPVIVATILALACALGLPAYSGPDELGHVAYAAALAQGHLPIIPTGEFADLATGTTWQGQHPPLFYVPAALLYLAAGKNPTISLYLIRILSCMGLVVTVVLIHRVASILLPRNMAALATWIVAAHPTVVYVSSMVNNEAWAMALSVACVWAALNATDAEEKDPKRRRLWLILTVVFGGVALLTKLTSIAGVVAAAVLLAQRQGGRAGMLRGLVIVAGAVALWLPWALTMQRLHGAFVPSPVQRPGLSGGPIALLVFPRDAAELICLGTVEFAIGLLTPYWLLLVLPFTHDTMVVLGWLIVAGILWGSIVQRRFRFVGAGFAILLGLVLCQILFRDGFAIFFLARYSPIATVLASLLLASSVGKLPPKVRTGIIVVFGLVSVLGFAYITAFFTYGPSKKTPKPQTSLQMRTDPLPPGVAGSGYNGINQPAF